MNHYCLEFSVGYGALVGFPMFLVPSSWWAALHACATASFLSVLLPASDERLLLFVPHLLWSSFSLRQVLRTLDYGMEFLSISFPASHESQILPSLHVCICACVCAVHIPADGWSWVGEGFPLAAPMSADFSFLSFYDPKHDQVSYLPPGTKSCSFCPLPWGISSLSGPWGFMVYSLSPSCLRLLLYVREGSRDGVGFCTSLSLRGLEMGLGFVPLCHWGVFSSLLPACLFHSTWWSLDKELMCKTELSLH